MGNSVNAMPSWTKKCTCTIPTSGSVTITSDCILYNQIVVTGKLNVTGIPDAQGNRPKIIGGGSNRLFKVQSSGELVLKSLNLTGGDVSDGYTGASHPEGSAETQKGGAVFIGGGAFNGINIVLWSNKARLGGALYGTGQVAIVLTSSA